LAAVLAVDDWFGVTFPARLLLSMAAALAVVALIGRSSRIQQPSPSPLTIPSRSPAPGFHESSELNLAIEHIESIRVLLQVSEAHNQPIPAAVPLNLDLVVKHLRRLNEACPAPADNRENLVEFVRSGPVLVRKR
jgi:hypothetical protein